MLAWPGYVGLGNNHFLQEHLAFDRALAFVQRKMVSCIQHRSIVNLPNHNTTTKELLERIGTCGRAIDFDFKDNLRNNLTYCMLTLAKKILSNSDTIVTIVIIII